MDPVAEDFPRIAGREIEHEVVAGLIAAREGVPIDRTGHDRLGGIAGAETHGGTAALTAEDAIGERVFSEEVKAEFGNVFDAGLIVDVRGDLAGGSERVVGGRAGSGAGLVEHGFGGVEPRTVDDGLEVAAWSPDDLGLSAFDAVLEVGRAPAEEAGIAERRAHREELGAEIQRLLEVGLLGAVIEHLVFAFAPEDRERADDLAVELRHLGAHFPIHALFVLDHVIHAAAAE